MSLNLINFIMLKVIDIKLILSTQEFSPWRQKHASKGALGIFKGYHPWTLYFERLCVKCIFSKNEATLDKVPLDLIRNVPKTFQGTKKSQFYFSRDHGCAVIVEYYRVSSPLISARSSARALLCLSFYSVYIYERGLLVIWGTAIVN